MYLMAVLAVVLGVLFGAQSAEAGPRTMAPLAAVESVDLRRYSGTWYGQSGGQEQRRQVEGNLLLAFLRGLLGHWAQPRLPLRDC
jgi:hypothetical protein